MIQGTPIRAYPNRDDIVIFPVEDVFAMRNLSLGAVTRCVIICRKDGQQDVIIDSNSVPAAFDFLATSVINGRKVYAIHWNPGVSIPGLFPEKGLWICDAYLYDMIHQKGMFVRTFPLQVMDIGSVPGGPVTYLAEDRSQWSSFSTYNFSLSNTNVAPEDFPNAVLVLTLATYATGFVPGGGFTPTSITIDGKGFAITSASGSDGFGGGQQGLVVATIRIPAGGFVDPTVHINWDIIGTSELNAYASAVVFYNVNESSDDFALGVVSGETLTSGFYANEAVIDGGMFVSNIQYTGGDYVANLDTSGGPAPNLYTMLGPNVGIGTGRYYMNGYMLFTQNYATRQIAAHAGPGTMLSPVIAFIMKGTGS